LRVLADHDPDGSLGQAALEALNADWKTDLRPS
jgi:hypothetical protein